MQHGDFLSNSVNSPYGRETFRQLPTTLRAARRTSMKFRQHFVPQGQLSSTFVYLPCILKTYCLFLTNIRSAGRPSIKLTQFCVYPGGLPSTSTKVLCSRDTFRNLPSNCVAREFRQLPLAFRAAARHSVNFR